MKWRNSKERELLASGGSREQTLPTKNNPNPDLSDVKEEHLLSPKQSEAASGLFLDQHKDDFANSMTAAAAVHVAASAAAVAAGSLDLLHHHHDSFLQQTPDAGGGSPISGSENLHSKLKIKDANSFNYNDTVQRYAAAAAATAAASGFGYQSHDSEYTDEDINVTDELAGSHNDDSDND